MADERDPKDDRTVVASAAGDETRFTGVAAVRSGMSSGPPEASIPPGSLLGHTYRIEAALARGGMGEVYRARHAELGTEHAVKIILPELANDQRIVDLFRREASVLRTIRHDAVVAYDGVFRDENGRLYLVMEFADGPSLSKLMRERSFTADEIRQLRDRLADGLAVAHEKGVIHRDISPDNVILPAGDVTQAKIIDFGISKLANPEGKTIIGDDFAGKFSYVSPEQLGMFGGQVDGRSDVYSLGLVLAAAAQGEPLDMGLSPISVIEARRSVPDLSRVPEGVRADLAAMLQPDPADRPSSMRDLVRGSERSGSRESPSAARLGERRAAANAPRRGRAGAMAVVGALAVLIVAGGLGSWYLWNGGAPSAQTGSSTQDQAAQDTAAPAILTQQPAQAATGSMSAADPAAAPTQAAPPSEPAAVDAPSSSPAAVEAADISTPSQAEPNAEPVIPPEPFLPTTTGTASTASEDTTSAVSVSPTVETVASDSASQPLETPVADLAATDQPPATPPTESADSSETPSSAAAAAASSAAPPETAEQPADTQTAQLPRVPDIRRLREDAQRTVQGLSCAGVGVEVSDAGDIAASGYVATEADRVQAGALLAALPEVGRVDNAVAVMPRPLCEALDVLRERTAFNLGSPRSPTIDPGGADGVYREGEHLLIAVTAPAHDGHLYVDYIDAAEGYVVHLLPNEMRPDNKARAGQQIVIGSLPQEAAKYTVSPPFGSNLLIAVVSPVPLFQGQRPQVEQADSYLAALRSGLEGVIAQRGREGLAANYRSVVFKP